MLKILDVLIGLATVMLLFSMVVTLITQSILTAIQSRGRNLKDGLAGLLKQLDSTLPDKFADDISEALLKHPLVAGQGVLKWSALGSVIHRDEFTTLLMEMASGQSPQPLEGAAKDALIKLLKNNGINDPAGALKNIRDFALQLEAADPTLTNSVRHGLAIVQEAKSEYVAKIHGWFDQTVDRVSQRFTANAHAITFVVGLVVAFAVQLDTIALVNRLASDEAIRAAVQAEAPALLKDAEAQQKQSAQTPGDQMKLAPAQQQLYDTLNKNGLIVAPVWKFSWPSSWKEIKNIVSVSPALRAGQIPGILISSLLLALGAPFWYKALQTLLKLKSTIAQKDDQQRKARQTGSADDANAPATATSPAGSGSATALPPAFQGEQGDLKAVG